MKTLLLTAAAVALLAMAGCDRKPAPATRAADGKVHILCTTFPMYLFTRNVTAGSKTISVEMMAAASAGCPHDYVLTPQDMQAITGADALIINGLGMEEFLSGMLAKAGPKVRIIDTSRGIDGVIEMAHEEAGHDDHHHEHCQFNPHLFASPKMAAKVVANIAAALGELAPGEASLFAANAAAYQQRLAALGEEFAKAAQALPNKKIVTQHAVFDYLARDCGLEIVAVIEAAPGQEPSAADMLKIIRTVRDSGAAAVFTEPQYSPKAAQAIARETNVRVAELDPVASGPADAPLDYYQAVMRANLATLQNALGRGDMKPEAADAAID
ncbi:MAG: zinc ABC transporter substrate-binding protein [Planctomycetaceae bacterium]|nr:zinc ABC transporter substrate-binding protein [Planctomycetaceae bacterium]